MVLWQVLEGIVLVFLCGKDIKDKQVSRNMLLVFAGICLAHGMVRCNKQEMSVFELGIGVSIGCALLVLSAITKEQIGAGDGLLVTALGFCMGKDNLTILSIASLVACMEAIFLLCTKKGNKKSQIAFMPAIGIGYVMTLFV